MPGPKENKASEVGMATRGGGHAESVKGIEGEHGHAGEKGSQGGVVFKIPNYVDHSCVRTPEKK